jgi:hypothetical protein
MTLTGSTFRAVANSTNGTLNTDTTMTFVSEDESSILGVYRGGTIRTGNVVATRKSPSTIEMLYHCVTTSGELKAGRAMGSFARNADGRLCMHLDWQWLTGDQSKGASEWIREA